MSIQVYSRNYVVDFDSITVTSGDTTKANLYDEDTATKHTSVGSSEGASHTITIAFAAVKTISSICLRNFNGKIYTIKYADTIASACEHNFSTPINETVNASTTKKHDFTAVAVYGIEIIITNTIGAVAEKYIGELIAYNQYIDIPVQWAGDEDPEEDCRASANEKLNGGIFKVYHSEINKYRTEISFDNLDKTYRDGLRLAFDAKNLLYFIPDTDDITAQYCGHWLGPWNFKKAEAWNTSGVQCYQGSFEFAEA